ncbi:unnamed protein product, partial [Urochloa humidicola]
ASAGGAATRKGKKLSGREKGDLARRRCRLVSCRACHRRLVRRCVHGDDALFRAAAATTHGDDLFHAAARSTRASSSPQETGCWLLPCCHVPVLVPSLKRKPPPPSFQLAIGTNPWADWSEHQNSIQRRKVSELDKYLEEEILPVGIPLDILQYWKTSSGTYPILACVARDMLAIPASTVALESAFSSGERIICDYRSRLTSETVEALIFQDWLKGDGMFSPIHYDVFHVC